MTDFRAWGTIMGLAGLTAVFGMGTGGAPPVSSPESDRGGVSPPDRGGPGVGHACKSSGLRGVVAFHPGRGPGWTGVVWGTLGTSRSGFAGFRRGRIGVVKRSAVRTGRLRRSPVVHSRPIDLVVFPGAFAP